MPIIPKMRPRECANVAVFVCFLLLVLLLFARAKGDDDCERRTTCGDCMGNAECVWCLDNIQDVNLSPRCFKQDSREAQDCKSTQDAESTTVMDENLPLNPDATSDEDIVLITPQSARASVRPGSKKELGHKIDFQVKKDDKLWGEY